MGTGRSSFGQGPYSIAINPSPPGALPLATLSLAVGQMCERVCSMDNWLFGFHSPKAIFTVVMGTGRSPFGQRPYSMAINPGLPGALPLAMLSLAVGQMCQWVYSIDNWLFGFYSPKAIFTIAWGIAPGYGNRSVAFWPKAIFNGDQSRMYCSSKVIP
jgi:hypothetical protein